jgi:hypothetical protein
MLRTFLAWSLSWASASLTRQPFQRPRQRRHFARSMSRRLRLSRQVSGVPAWRLVAAGGRARAAWRYESVQHDGRVRQNVTLEVPQARVAVRRRGGRRTDRRVTPRQNTNERLRPGTVAGEGKPTSLAIGADHVACHDVKVALRSPGAPAGHTAIFAPIRVARSRTVPLLSASPRRQLGKKVRHPGERCQRGKLGGDIRQLGCDAGRGREEARQTGDRADQLFRLTQREAETALVRMASGEYRGWSPRLVRGSARRAATTSSVNHTVRSPRWRRPASQAGEFVSRRFCSGM